MENLVKLQSASTYRGETVRVTVEVQVMQGIGIHVMGLRDDNRVKETLLRTITALQSRGYRIPGKKIVINVVREKVDKPLPPGEGNGWYDLPIALGILIASGQIACSNLEIRNSIFVGELRLDGTIMAPKSGFVFDDDAARAVAWKFRGVNSVCGWDTMSSGGGSWEDFKDLDEVIEYLR